MKVLINVQQLQIGDEVRTSFTTSRGIREVEGVIKELTDTKIVVISKQYNMDIVITNKHIQTDKNCKIVKDYVNKLSFY